MRRLFSIGLVVFCAAALASAAPSGKRQRIVFSSASSAPALYRIELTDGRAVPSVGVPSAHGSVIVYRAPGGALTSVPREMVLRIVGEGAPAAGSAAAPDAVVRADRIAPSPVLRTEPSAPLEPGDLVVLGPTGEGPLPAQAGMTAPAAAPASTAAGNGVGAYGYGGAAPNNGLYAGTGTLNPNAINPSVTTIGPDGLPRVVSSTDLTRAMSPTTTVDANGFPLTNSPTVIGPNGTPTLAPGFPGATTMIGPNGTPVFAGSGQAGSANPVIGPNGTPVLAQPGQPGSGQPQIGPNGTPVLAQPGQPGSGAAAPGTAPNGTPASPPPSGGKGPGSR